ncbi:hypothetical protein [Rhizobium sp. CSW-27]|uniref:hypothetical protein n=1 Tax=Rhizobium sp. CSW-27 TaxID=2839985 RepID=UPI001C034D26|nr:hypothetical protein [Rhizobium sp. CSW-27]MBT9368287.1 hypothetical protein [Rhizobium sp. CSW-27]
MISRFAGMARSSFSGARDQQARGLPPLARSQPDFAVALRLSGLFGLIALLFAGMTGLAVL